MTKQEIFDIAAPALLKQGTESMRRQNPDPDDDDEYTAELICAYRGLDGMKCAIGHVIPDSIYDAQMEGRGVMELYTMYPAFRELLTGEGDWDTDMATFLTSLQEVHDHNSPSQWKDELTYLAGTWNLNIDSIK